MGDLMGMELQTLHDAINVKQRECDVEIDKLRQEYAYANNDIKIGDIIEDCSGKIKVEKIQAYLTVIPQCAYTGINYTRAGKISKREPTRTIFQTYVIT